MTTITASASAQPVTPDSDETKPEWELPGEYLRDNGLRGEVPLNAFWLGRAEGATEDEVVRVPDVSTNKREPSYRYTREFVVPAGWEKRRLFVTGAVGAVTLNGELLGAGPVDLPYGELGYELPANLLRAEGPQQLSIQVANIRTDVWLRSYPQTPIAIGETYLTTSFREGRVSVALDGRATADSVITPVVKIFADADATQLVKTLSGPSTLRADAEGNWQTTVSGEWKDAKLWSPDEPNLYYYTVELSDAAGTRVDQVLPRSFGFRELWSNGRDLLMNGVPVRFTGDTWSRGLVADVNVMEQQAVAVVRAMKAAGIRAGWRTDAEVMFEVADREGMMLTYSYLAGLDIPVHINVLTGADEAGDAGGDAEIRNKAELSYETSRNNIIRKIKQRREHPSILAWHIRSPWSRFTLHPGMQGITANPWDFWPGNDQPELNRRRYDVATQTRELIQAHDSARPVAAQNSPDADIEFSTRYLCDNLDLQERAEFFRHYAEGVSQRVLWPSETDVTPFPGHNFLRQSAHQMPQGKPYPAIHVENAARLFGDGVYLTEPDEVLKNWYRMQDDKHRRSPVYQQLTAENLRDVTRGWRTAGISHNGHWVLREGMTPSNKKRVEDRLGIPRQVDPRRPGLSRVVGNPDQPSSFHVPGVDILLPGGEAYLRNISPLLAYIGGGSDNVYARDHLYYAGEPVTKRVVLLNDYMMPVDVKGAWELVDAAGVVHASGELSATIQPGARSSEQMPITFAAPQVESRSDFTLRLKLNSPTPGVLDDAFAITVFPRHEKPAATPVKVWHLDARGFGDLLGAAGMTSTVIPDSRGWDSASAPPLPKPGDLLLIPRSVLSPDRDQQFDGLRTLGAMGFDKLVEDGLRVIVFEQDVPNLMGLQTESVRPRRVFISADGHPVFDGLQASDMTYWSGSSNLQLPVGAISMSESFPDRLWQVNNTNVVASRTLYRPQTGAARALAVSGFDLGETPLLEVVRGKGRMLFCQLDVSNRYGTDPVATLLVDNMIRYMATVAEPTAKMNDVKVLKEDGAEVVEQKDVFRAAKPGGGDGWGMTQAELFFRESIYANNWITKQRPDVSVPVFAGAKAETLPAVIRRVPETGQYETTLDASTFATGWAKRKVAILRAAMLLNQDGSSQTGPALHLHGNSTELYPYTWIEGFVHPYTAACW